MSGVTRVGEPRIARCALVIIGTHTELRLGKAFANRRSHGSQIAGDEGNGNRVPGCCINAGAGCIPPVALGRQRRTFDRIGRVSL